MTETTIHSAPDELLALAKAMRPDWDHDVLAAAILAAKSAGWSWVRTFSVTVKLMAGEDASPWDLKHAAANPLERASVPDPGAAKHGAALARELLMLNGPDEAA
jgi:hypothetical protein